MARIVNYQQIRSATNGREMAEVVGDAMVDSDGIGREQVATVIAWMSRGLDALRDTSPPDEDADILTAPEDHPQAMHGALLQSFLAEHAATTTPLPGVGEEVKFDERDIVRWATSVSWSWLENRLTRPKPTFRRPTSALPVSIPDNARLAIVGDWGTGMYGAPVCAASIDREHFDLIVHLGDVYYTGTAHETRESFVTNWPRTGPKLGRVCNSNHDMYSRGEGLFDVALPLVQQDSTVWAVANKHWLLIGLDTAIEGPDLQSDQIQWLGELLATQQRDRRVMLFSHHQPFSLLSNQHEGLQAALEPLLTSCRVDRWYWGHEHRMVAYDLHPRWGLHGRCVGHSGYPYFADTVMGHRSDLEHDQALVSIVATDRSPGGRLLIGPNRFVPPNLLNRDRSHRFGPNGYVTVELGAGTIHEQICDAGGDVLVSGL
jgi:predicted phosphodiesterase